MGERGKAGGGEVVRGGAGRQGYVGGVVWVWYGMMMAGLVAFFWKVPWNAARAVETENGVWFGGVNLGVILGVVMMGVAVVFAVLELQRSGDGEKGAGWLVEGLGLVGQGVTGAMWVGVCGLIGWYGYDGFLYAVGLVGGWFLALVLAAGAMERMGARSMMDVMRVRGAGRLARRVAAGSTLVVVVGMLAAELVAAGAVWRGVVPREWIRGMGSVGMTAMGGGVIVVLALMLGEGGKWRRLLAGAALVTAAVGLAVAVSGREVKVKGEVRRLSTAEFRERLKAGDKVLPETGAWADLHLARVRHEDGTVTVWRYMYMQRLSLEWPGAAFVECREETAGDAGALMGGAARLPERKAAQRAEGPVAFLGMVAGSDVALEERLEVEDEAGRHVIAVPVAVSGEDLLVPGMMPGMWEGLMGQEAGSRWNLLSLMAGLFFGVCGVPAMYSGRGGGGPARAVGVAGVASVMLAGLFVGLGALMGGAVGAEDANRAVMGAAGLFGPWAKVGVAIVMMMVLVGTGRRMLSAGTEAVRELMGADGGRDGAKEMGGDGWDWRAVIVGAMAVGLGWWWREVNTVVLVGWVLGVAAAAHVPALVTGWFWRGVTGRGMAAAMVTGLVVAVLWVLGSAEGMGALLGVEGRWAMVPFCQPAAVGMAAGWVMLVVVSLLTRGEGGINKGEV